MPEVEQEEPRRSDPSLKSKSESRAGFSKRSTFAAILEQICQLVLITHLRVTRIRAYLASAAGPPGAIYSSNRGLPEHPPTVPREKRDWKAEKRNREEHRCGWAASLGPIRGTHREKVITKCTGNDQNERTR